MESVQPLSTEKLRLRQIADFRFEKETDLSNWEVVEGDWEAREGILSTKASDCKILYRKPLTNFMVRGRFKILSGGEKRRSFSFVRFFLRSEKFLSEENNGIYYELDSHSSISDFRRNRALLWYQWTVRDEKRTPWYWPDRLVATFPAVVEVEQWHSFEIWVKGSMLLYRLDGKIALIYDKVAIHERKFGFMNRGSQVYFDDIELFEIG